MVPGGIGRPKVIRKDFSAGTRDGKSDQLGGQVLDPSAQSEDAHNDYQKHCGLDQVIRSGAKRRAQGHRLIFGWPKSGRSRTDGIWVLRSPLVKFLDFSGYGQNGGPPALARSTAGAEGEVHCLDPVWSRYVHGEQNGNGVPVRASFLVTTSDGEIHSHSGSTKCLAY